jgi:antitoxin PrlF
LHPEFRQKAKVRAQIISPGHALIAVVDDEAALFEDEDLVVTAFLAFIEKDLKERPGRRTRLSKTSLRRAVRLTKDVKVSDGEKLPDDVTF